MAGKGLKSDFGGQWHHQWNNIYAYVGSCLGSGNNLAFYNNTCITHSDGYACDFPPTMTVGGNRVLTKDGNKTGCQTDTSGRYPSDAAVETMATGTLAPFPMAAHSLGR